MSFSEMLNVLGVSNSFLTYHLENLGELLGKTDDGRYRLSSFGEDAMTMMARVEDIPATAFHQSSGTRTKKIVGKNVAVALGIVCVLLVAGLGGAIAYYTMAINNKIAAYDSYLSSHSHSDSDYGSLNSQVGNLQNQYNQLQAWLNGNETLLNQTQIWLDGNETALRQADPEMASIIVPDDYSTIQDAINHANSGDTIFVRSGAYPDQYNLQVNKPVTLIGQSSNSTIIESHGILITASNVTLQGFNITCPNDFGGNCLVEIEGQDTNCSYVTIRNNLLLDPGADNSPLGARPLFDRGHEMLDDLGSQHDVISGNQIIMQDPNDSGIALLFQADNNIVDNNTVIGGWSDLYCGYSDGNVFSNNYVSNQTAETSDVGAACIAYASGIIVKGNTFAYNAIGFSAPYGQPEVTVYQNNFINNTQQVLPIPDPFLTMDNGYPSGGNYWSDYNGTDSYSGPYQNITGSDGIGDTPYIINGSIIDRYPLMKAIPYTSDPYAVLGDINGDGKVGLDDLVILADAHGTSSNRLIIGIHEWNPNADLNHDGKSTFQTL